MFKCCSQCKVSKPRDQFRRDRTRADGYAYHCKQCRQEVHQRNYYARYKDKVDARNESQRAQHKQWCDQYKKDHPCIRCGESDICCLDFHHVDPTMKKYTISVERTRLVSTLQKEVEKCVILCSNCHRKLHANRFTI